MIAFDTNILVYAHRKDSAFHERAAACVRACAEGSNTWAIPWPCVHEFLAIVTNSRIWRAPTPLPAALAQVDAWRESASLRLLAEDGDYWTVLSTLLGTSRLGGAKIHDARIAALALHHGVRELLSADRDFSRITSLAVRNPL